MSFFTKVNDDNIVNSTLSNSPKVFQRRHWSSVLYRYSIELLLCICLTAVYQLVFQKRLIIIKTIIEWNTVRLLVHTMVVTGSWWIAGNNLNTTIRSVVSSLAFLAVVVSHVVCVLLIKLQTTTLQFNDPVPICTDKYSLQFLIYLRPVSTSLCHLVLQDWWGMQLKTQISG